MLWALKSMCVDRRAAELSNQVCTRLNLEELSLESPWYSPLPFMLLNMGLPAWKGRLHMNYKWSLLPKSVLCFSSLSLKKKKNQHSDLNAFPLETWKKINQTIHFTSSKYNPSPGSSTVGAWSLRHFPTMGSHIPLGNKILANWTWWRECLKSPWVFRRVLLLGCQTPTMGSDQVGLFAARLQCILAHLWLWTWESIIGFIKSYSASC